MRSGFAPDVQATGVIDGNFSYERNGGERPSSDGVNLNGQATLLGATVTAPGFDKLLALPAIHLTTSVRSLAHIVSHTDAPSMFSFQAQWRRRRCFDWNHLC